MVYINILLFFSALCLATAQFTILYLAHMRKKTYANRVLMFLIIAMTLFCLYDLLVFYSALRNPETARSLPFRMGIFISIAFFIIWTGTWRMISDDNKISFAYTAGTTTVIIFNFIVFLAGELSFYEEIPAFTRIFFTITGILWITAFIISVLYIYRTVFLKAYADKTSDAQNASYPDFDLDRRVGEIADEYDITDREADIMRLIFYGMSNNEIADQLFISTSTVKSHIHSILQKTGAKSRSEIMFLIYNPMIIERSYGEDR